MIPKIIHYCWFGQNPKPASVLKCIDSWKKYFPDYEIKEWNELNYDIYSTDFSRYCYENKKWAFVSDLARLKIVNSEGGIYFDTDVEVIKKPVFLADNDEVDGFFGYETNEYIATGLGFGSIANSPILDLMIQQYARLKPDENGNYQLISCPQLNTLALREYGLEINGGNDKIGNVIFLSAEYMNPYDDPTGILNITDNTFSIHWYSKSWMSRTTVLRSKITRPFHKMFGVNCFRWLKRKQN